MQITKFRLLPAFAAALFLLAAIPAIASSHKAMEGHGEKKTISVQNVWARATAPSASNGAAYMTLSISKGSDTLKGVSGSVADRVEMHNHLNDMGVMKMRQVQGIAVDEGSPTLLLPGGLHIMLIGLKAPLKEGDSFPLTLEFEKSGKQTIEVMVTGIRGIKMDDHQGHDINGHKY